MITISLCMIVKNEESCLGQCLESVHDLVDEIIVVDTGSTDNTPSIIKKYTDATYQFEWINDFSAARNYAFSKATKEYILWLDADDVLLENDRALLKALKDQLDPSTDIITMIYDITFNDKGECILSIPRDKLIKNNKGFYWRYFVHEELVVWGTYFHSNIHITHTSDHGHYSRYLANYEKRLADGYTLEPHERYFYGGELYMAGHYEQCINVLLELIKGPFLSDNEMLRAYLYIADSYRKKAEYKKALIYTLSTLAFALPDATTCYQVGLLYYQLKKYDLAIYWYKLVLNDCHTAVATTEYMRCSTYIQLCLCYYYQNNLKEAVRYNDLALTINPDDSNALHNKAFFNTL